MMQHMPILTGYKSEESALEQSTEHTGPGRASAIRLKDGTYVGLGEPRVRVEGEPAECQLHGMAGSSCWESEAQRAGLLGATLSAAISPETHHLVSELQKRGWKTKNLVEVAVGLLAALDRLQPGESLVIGRTPEDTPTAQLMPTPEGGAEAEDWDTVAAAAVPTSRDGSS